MQPFETKSFWCKFNLFFFHSCPFQLSLAKRSKWPSNKAFLIRRPKSVNSGRKTFLFSFFSFALFLFPLQNWTQLFDGQFYSSEFTPFLSRNSFIFKPRFFWHKNGLNSDLNNVQRTIRSWKHLLKSKSNWKSLKSKRIQEKSIILFFN